MTTRAGFVALIGEPNAGKSTLLNRMVGAKVSIVTHKVQTTRARIRGVAMEADTQIVFVDTPGLFQPRRRLDRAMVAAAWGGAADADVVVLMVEAHRGVTEGVERIIEGLADNGLKVVNDWETVYNIEFSRWGGTRPVVVSYGSSPPFEVLYAEEPMDSPPTGVLTADGACYRQIEFAGILTNAPNPELAGKFIDFMLGLEFQEDIPLNMFVFPANREAALPDVFIEHTIVPENPATLDPAAIDANRQRWIEEWDAVMLP